MEEHLEIYSGYRFNPKSRQGDKAQNNASKHAAAPPPSSQPILSNIPMTSDIPSSSESEIDMPLTPMESHTIYEYHGSSICSRSSSSAEKIPAEIRKYISSFCGTNFAWCQYCETTWFKEKYSSCTTGNLQLDLIIQKSQAEASINGDYIEYIPYDQFELIKFHKAGAFSESYSAIWLKGPQWNWNENTQAWSRGGPIKVALKKLINTQNLNKQFFENLRKYHRCLQSGSVADTFGISKAPDGFFVFVMRFYENGNLNQYIKNVKEISWKDKIDLLWGITAGLENIHRSNIYHGNLHGGNIMIEDESISTDGRIADIGIHGVDIPYNNNKLYGVMPYIAPDTLLGEEIENTPKCFSDLMKRCWAFDPKQRPTAIELNEIFSDRITDICANPVPTGISEEFSVAEERRCESFQIQKNTPQEIQNKNAFYTSRFFDFSEL
ncbi:11138_t:CDS:2 [Ambispora gerdemannii]|uniref:11138_t:CDS:1 n=1 Tax=Ambispora gerdemannii TaxID=144530 RepID=A0A9N8VSJ9_9GLOM|nr:11138_t:CDS:2 [Ambispora gerdemannii]